MFNHENSRKKMRNVQMSWINEKFKIVKVSFEKKKKKS